MRLRSNEYFWTSPRGGPEVCGSSATTGSDTERERKHKPARAKTRNMDAVLRRRFNRAGITTEGKTRLSKLNRGTQVFGRRSHFLGEAVSGRSMGSSRSE